MRCMISLTLMRWIELIQRGMIPVWISGSRSELSELRIQYFRQLASPSAVLGDAQLRREERSSRRKFVGRNRLAELFRAGQIRNRSITSVRTVTSSEIDFGSGFADELRGASNV